MVVMLGGWCTCQPNIDTRYSTIWAIIEFACVKSFFFATLGALLTLMKSRSRELNTKKHERTCSSGRVLRAFRIVYFTLIKYKIY